MNIKIDKEGYLYVERAGKMSGQYCPYYDHKYESDYGYCGDWCPHFGEPEVHVYRNPVGVNSYSDDEMDIELTCGNGHVITGMLTDERRKL